MAKVAAATAVLAFCLPMGAEAHIIGKPHGHSDNKLMKYLERQYNHTRYVCMRGTGEPKRWHCAASRWIKDELGKVKARMQPVVDPCLHELIDRESGWNVHATNPRTGAYGLPQALPGSKMASAGPNWRHDAATQIRWMKGYVQKYGGSCGALAFQIAHGWY